MACSPGPRGALYRAPGRLVGSAWGSDILVAPVHSAALRWLTSRVLRACTLTTSDSQVMAARMRELGAREVMVFPFGLEAMPDASTTKEPWLFFANRGLEPIYAPHRVLQVFASVAERQPKARLIVANEGSMRGSLERQSISMGLAGRVQFTGRLDADTQDQWYARAQWYLSLPSSDSVAVSVLEAMGHGCIPVLSDLPANRELVRDGENGLIAPDSGFEPSSVLALAPHAARIAEQNRAWVAQHGLFAPAVAQFIARLTAAGRAVNILLVNHYAGSTRHGMEYRPYYLAREWVRAGHRVQIVASSWSHARSLQPDVAGEPVDERIDGIDYRWLPTPPYRGNGVGRVRNIWAFLRRLWRESKMLVDRVKPDVVIASSTYPFDIWVARRIARHREGRARLRSARPLASIADRARRHVAATSVHRPVPEGRERRLSRRRPRRLDAAQGGRAHECAWARPEEARSSSPTG